MSDTYTFGTRIRFCFLGRGPRMDAIALGRCCLGTSFLPIALSPSRRRCRKPGGPQFGCSLAEAGRGGRALRPDRCFRQMREIFVFVSIFRTCTARGCPTTWPPAHLAACACCCSVVVLANSCRKLRKIDRFFAIGSEFGFRRCHFG